MTNLRVVLTKSGIYGILGMFWYDGKYFLTSWDERKEGTSVKMEEDKTTAQKLFDEAVAVSCDQGWTVLYYGKPNIAS